MSEQKEGINPFEYNYEEGQMVEVEGKLLHAVITYLKQIEEDNIELGFSHTYDKTATEIKEGNLIVAVETDKQDYKTMTSYMNQQACKFTKMPGVIAFDLLQHLTKPHLENIKNGVAKKLGVIQTPTDEEIKLS